jgi:hypothetical protein
MKFYTLMFAGVLAGLTVAALTAAPAIVVLV